MRLNHAVLYVSDVVRSAKFYCEVLGFSEVFSMGPAKFLLAPNSDNDHDLGLFPAGPETAGASRRSVGLYHLAWEVRTLGELRDFERRLGKAGLRVGASDHGTTKSLYSADPDGIEFEIMWRIPLNRLTEADRAKPPVSALDLDAEIARFGEDCPGEKQ